MERPVEIRCPKCLTWFITVQDRIERCLLKRSIFPKFLEFHVFVFASFSTKITSSSFIYTICSRKPSPLHVDTFVFIIFPHACLCMITY